MATDNRQFHRVKFAAKTVVECGTAKIEASLVDISMKGALLRFTDVPDLPPKGRCLVSVTLDASDIVLHFEAEVVHVRSEFIGLKFVGIDIDTMIHLRSLLELNTADPDQVRSELAIFLGNR